jgi:hypothetical protein
MLLTRRATGFNREGNFTVYDFQERMADGRAAAKRNRERNGTSPYECFANERQRFAGMSDDDWHARCADDEAYAAEVGEAVDATSPVPQSIEKERPMRQKQPKRTTGTRQPALGAQAMPRVQPTPAYG